MKSTPSGVSKRVVRSKQMRERCERTSERKSEWPSTIRVYYLIIRLTLAHGFSQSILQCMFILYDHTEENGECDEMKNVGC